MKHGKEKEKLGREWKEQMERNTVGTVCCFPGHSAYLGQYVLKLDTVFWCNNDNLMLSTTVTDIISDLTK
jgi:hypothetical protein